MVIFTEQAKHCLLLREIKYLYLIHLTAKKNSRLLGHTRQSGSDKSLAGSSRSALHFA